MGKERSEESKPEYKIEKKLKEDWDYNISVIRAAVTTGTELVLLDISHKNAFNKPLTEEYIDYSLDRYEFHRSKGKSEPYSKYASIIETVTKMGEDKEKMLKALGFNP